MKDLSANEERDSNSTSSTPLVIGWIVTTALIGTYVLLGFHVDCKKDVCLSKFQEFMSSPPNAIGDTLAGLAGTLAFLWIIVTVMLQRQELKLQREELRMQRFETEKTREVMQSQLLIAANQDISLHEQRTDEFIIGLLESIYSGVESLRGALMSWNTRFLNEQNVQEEKELSPFEIDTEVSTGFLSLAGNLLDTKLSLLFANWQSEKLKRDSVEIIKKPIRTHLHHGLLELLERVITEQKSCSAQMRLKIQRLAIQQFFDRFNDLMERDDFWSGDFDPEDYLPDRKA